MFKRGGKIYIVKSIYLAAMLQADDEDDMMEQQMKSPFGSSFRTFDATDYKPIGTAFYLVSLFLFSPQNITCLT